MIGLSNNMQCRFAGQANQSTVAKGNKEENLPSVQYTTLIVTKSLFVASEATILRIRLCCYDLLLLLFCLVLSQSQEACVHLVHSPQLSSAMGWLAQQHVHAAAARASFLSLVGQLHCAQQPQLIRAVHNHADAGTVEACGSAAARWWSERARVPIDLRRNTPAGRYVRISKDSS